ncbi:type 1 fimbrial protein [Enterobacter sp. WCHEn045836]|uniref:fimbrial protein n=1 Tax=Enterobacter sp. WCHEn045836 TaxID=2497434 RepID=UPI000F820570|nr:fimbrial protein [Enterobacter sp. WCHEn045836]RTP97276.1 type 1 fimbrial protein [Enterobacter sp. WCHEn045836]
MKLNKIMAAAVIALGVSSVAHAANQGSGKVTFTGAIIDAPCSINPDSVDQTVELGQVSNALLKKGGKSASKSFDILLENCEIEEGKNSVSVTFTGTASEAQDGMLDINGSASGASVAIADKSGKLIKLGEASPAQDVAEGSTKLSFNAYLQGNGTSDVVPGDFTAVADFQMAYQ